MSIILKASPYHIFSSYDEVIPNVVLLSHIKHFTTIAPSAMYFSNSFCQ